ncbi:hypothetical protein ACFFNY_13830 [Paenibacillus hodogayensis]|uniref:DUF1002 domain-containing protein n=1 Tax=Paenibacillus hodogayensis TaxID=279208 RepID=A0ABV5VWE2_9BACL
MNYRMNFKTVALSALLMSAIAAPVAANADNNEAKPTEGSGAVTRQANAETFSIVKRTLSNPLELARKYAPDTVGDWESTLETYNKLWGVHSVTVSSNGGALEGVKASVAAVKLSEADLEKLKLDIKEGTALPFVKISDRLPADDATLQALPTSAVPFNLEKSITFSTDGIKLSPEEMKEGVAIAIGAVSEAGTAATTGVAELREATAFSSLIKAQIALDEAVQSENAGTIQSSLAELLKQYKTQIAERQAAAAE